ncbi:hypothetical protein [Brevundimonas sp.]
MNVRGGIEMDDEMKRLVDRWVAVFLEMPVLLDAGLMRPMLAEAERRLDEEALATETKMRASATR